MIAFNSFGMDFHSARSESIDFVGGYFVRTGTLHTIPTISHQDCSNLFDSSTSSDLLLGFIQQLNAYIYLDCFESLSSVLSKFTDNCRTQLVSLHALWQCWDSIFLRTGSKN